MNFEAYVPYDVKDDLDLRARGSVSYGKILPSKTTQPTTTASHTDKFLEETSKPYLRDLSRDLDLDEAKAPKYFAQILQGIAEESKKRAAKATIMAYTSSSNPIENNASNLQKIEALLNNTDNKSLKINLTSGMDTQDYYMTHAGIMAIPYYNAPTEGVITTKGIGFSIPDIQEVSLNVGGENDDRFDLHKSIEFSSIKFAKLIKKYGSIPPAIYAYFSGEEFVDALMVITESSATEGGSSGTWSNPTDTDIKEALEVVSKNSGDMLSNELDLEFYSASIMETVLSYVSDTQGIKDIVYNDFTSVDIGGGSQVGSKANSENVQRAVSLHQSSVSIASEEFGIDPDLLYAIMAQESWGGKADTTGNGWGPMQIEDTGGKSGYPYERCSGGANPVCVNITKNKNTDERLDSLNSIRWAAAHLRYLADQFDGDQLKALLAYNMGLGAVQKLVKAYPDDWMNNINKIPSLLGKLKHGDPNYLANVLGYYGGTDFGSLTFNRYNQTGNSNFKQLFNTIDLLIGKDYDNFRNSGVANFTNHLSAEQANTVIAKSAGHRVEDIDITKPDFYFTILDFFGNPYNTSSMSGGSTGLFGGSSSAGNLEEMRPYIYNIDTYRTPLDADANGFLIITSGVGPRKLSISSTHDGLDYGYPTGTKVFSIADGEVIHSTNNGGGYGQYIMISHPTNEEGTQHIISLYAHLSKRLVEKGQKVKAGQEIGRVGSTGIGTGAHLHFEIQVKRS
ncbi:MAG: M23 family metallopeptidase, partial [Epulopiscium sp.]|nr:M23 family metallopeptidase [Candidatus Epulonipiscium sp.]